ncbi:hypothetical protein L218DRAFT_1082312, partial [Marasmius fiardii PR-910]
DPDNHPPWIRRNPIGRPLCYVGSTCLAFGSTSPRSSHWTLRLSLCIIFTRCLPRSLLSLSNIWILYPQCLLQCTLLV